MSVEIVVDELVVRGLPPEQARVAAAALGERLAVLAGAEAAIRPRSEAFRRLPAVEAPAASPAAAGEAVAGAVWSELAGGGRR